MAGEKSGFDNIFSALADVATRSIELKTFYFTEILVIFLKRNKLGFEFLYVRAKSTFSEALLPGNEERVGRSGSLFERFYERFAKKPTPEVAAQLQALDRFSQPELLQITQVGLQSF